MFRRGVVVQLALVAATTIGLGSIGPSAVGSAQVQPAADTILVNGKVLTMDSDHPGRITVAEAVAIREGRFVAVGGNASVRALAVADTRIINLEGRTVIPGIVDTHQHFDYCGGRAPEVVPPAISISGTNAAEVREAALSTIVAEAAARPAGDWITISLPRRVLDETGEEVDIGVLIRRGLITKEDLDAAAPNHPVMANYGTNTVVNSTTIAMVFAATDESLGIDLETGHAGLGTRRRITSEVQAGSVALNAARFKLSLERSAACGQTTISTHLLRGQLNPAAIIQLSNRGEMAIRLAVKDELIYSFGPTDMVWNTGVGINTDSSYPGLASTAPASPEIKAREHEGLPPGSPRRIQFETAVRNGQRLAGGHVAGDLTLDHVMDLIEAGSAAAGLTADDIRSRRHAADHCTMHPRPDQIPRLRDLGMILSCQPKYIRDTTPLIARDYGPEFTKWSAPVGSLIEAGVRVVYGSDENRANVVFEDMETLVTRRSNDGQVYNPEERIDRMTALLMATRWSAEYVLREQVLGSIEVGKWADLVVLDRDYQAVPDEEIAEVHPVVTMVGGKIVYRAQGVEL